MHAATGTGPQAVTRIKSVRMRRGAGRGAGIPAREARGTREARERMRGLSIPETWKHPVEQIKLRYVSADEPGYHRVKRRGKFVHVDDHGREVRDEKVLKRIKALVLPPAW